MNLHIPVPPTLARCAGAMVEDRLLLWRHPVSGSLWTSWFYETGIPERGLHRLKDVDWEVVPPAGAELFLASSGRSVDELGMVWLGWREHDTLQAVSLYREEPICCALEAGDRVLWPAVMAPSRQLHVYVWRPEGDGWRLHRFCITGEPGPREPAVTCDALPLTSTEPHLSALEPLTGHPDGGVALAWCEERDGTVMAHVARLVGAAVERVSVPVDKDLVLTLPQQVSLWAPVEGAWGLSFVATQRDTGRLVHVELQVDLSTGGVRARSVLLASGRVPPRAACCLPGPRAQVFLLEEDGSLRTSTGARLIEGASGAGLPSLVRTFAGTYRVLTSSEGHPTVELLPAPAPSAVSAA